jgi:hypothetical protein
MDELELQTREALDGRPITQKIFPFQVPARARACCAGGAALARMPVTEPGKDAAAVCHSWLCTELMRRCKASCGGHDAWIM